MAMMFFGPANFKTKGPIVNDVVEALWFCKAMKVKKFTN